MLLKGIPEVQQAARPASAAEMVLIRLAHAASLPTLDEALKALEDGDPLPSAPPAPSAPVRQPPNGGGSVMAVAQARVPSGGGGQTMRLVEPGPAEAAAPERGVAAPAVDEAPPVRVASLADIAALAEADRDLAFKVLLKRCVRPVRIEPGRIDVALTGDAPKTLLTDLNARLRKWTGRAWLVSLSREEGGPTLAEEEAARRESAILDARADPAVAAILAKFPGARIVNVRIPENGAGEADDAAGGADDHDSVPEPPADDEDD
jgi:DNA polymerase-3 subunit gamma/tau